MTPPASFTPSGTATLQDPQITTETNVSAHIEKPAPRSEGSTTAHVDCPVCQRKMLRIWRRPSDRLLSMFTPLHRYRCDFHDCRWEGNFRRPRSQREIARRGSAAQVDSTESSVPASFFVHMTLVVLGVVTVFAAANSDWWSTGDSLVANTPWSAYERIGVPEAGVVATQANDSSTYQATGR